MKTVRIAISHQLSAISNQRIRMKDNPASCILYPASCIVILLALLLLPSLSNAAVMQDYCLVPPYVKRDVSVNIMILMDNSEDMLGPAYTDTTYCPSKPVGNINCWGDHDSDPATSDYYFNEYIGHFPPTACYNPNVGGKFKYAGHNVNYTTYPDTGCPEGEFNGNILNWATMSKITIAKKVLTGEASNSPAKPFAIEGKKSFWDDALPTSGGNNYRDQAGCRWWITSTSNDVLQLKLTEPGAAGSCKYPKNATYDVEIDPTVGIEVRRGVLQYFTDVNPQDNSFDQGAPRFGLTKFQNVAGVIEVNIAVPIPPTGVYSSFINNFNSSLGTNLFNELASAHYIDIEYFKNPPSVSKDPYKGCASWEGSSCPSDGTARPCRQSAILMLTTGGNVSGTTYTDAQLPSQCPTTETRPLVRNACYAFNTDLRTDADLPGKQNLKTYVIQTFGTAGSYSDCTDSADVCATLSGNAKVLCDAAIQGGGKYCSAGTSDLEGKILQMLLDIIKRAAAGTAASVLASGEGQGANLAQAVFYPRAQKIQLGGIFDREIDWIGRLVNYWYYVDPLFANSNIREDTTQETPDRKLNLVNDYIATLYYDSTAEQTKASRCIDTNGDGGCDDTSPATVTLENLKNLWEAGVELWKRDLSTSPRTIKTTTGSGLIDFSTTNASALRDYLQAADDTEASNIIRYIHGEDIDINATMGHRSRTVKVDLNGDGDVTDTGETTEHVWKLGDILNSTPKISSWMALNNYDTKYHDSSYSAFLNSSTYTSRGMVFAGANDGMLHAIKLGDLGLPDSSHEAGCSFGSGDKACLTGTDLGKEVWAFIPKNVLPYLKYIADPGYCHLYSVDLSPYIFDASIGDSGCSASSYADCSKYDASGNPITSRWKTILIGGMRFGGACRNLGSTCIDCVKTPKDGLGYSSYFALDITDQNSPTLLWEFSRPADQDLGFTTTGPAVVRIGSDTTKNGKWFVVFGSGPTGPTTGASSTEYQFLGRSDQELKLFIFDLKEGPSGGVTVKTTGKSNAFAGSMLNATHDTDTDYQDDVLYIPYVQKDATVGTWTKGGVLRLLTRENSDPSAWELSTVIDNIGPVTSAVARLQHQKKGQLWLYFGSGRYYFRRQTGDVDDPDDQRILYGIKEPCFSTSGFAATCSSLGSLSNATDVTDANSLDPDTINGWYINLDLSGSYIYSEGGTYVKRNYKAERVITDPFSTTSGLVFYTTYKPYNDVCALGGKTFIWAVKYNTGGEPGALLKGKALVQVSTGSIEQVDLSTAFTEKGRRRTSAMEGVPPTMQGLSLLSTPPPVKRVIHMRER